MRLSSLLAVTGLVALATLSGPGLAIVPVSPEHVPHDLILPTLQVVHDPLDVQVSLLDDAGRDLDVQAALAPFRQRHGGNWEVRWDSRGNRANLVQGSGVPLLPGRGNTLPRDAVPLSGDMPVDLPVVAALARQFIDGEQELLATTDLELHLDPDRSTSYGTGNTHWFIEFQQHHQGIPVDGSFVFVRIAHGNVVQFGAERIGQVHLASNRTTAPERDQAFAQAWQQLGFPAGTKITEWLEPGELRVFPLLPAGQALAQPHSGLRGLGYEHLLAWRYVFRVDEHATWQVLFDADRGRIIDLRDLTVNADAEVTGGVYPTTNTDAQVIVPFPFATVTNNGTQTTDIDGVYDYTGGTASTALNGRYFRMVDNCGSISLSNSTDGNLAFGTSAGTDCTTPGSGGGGNTHATRTGFYHLTLINTKARTILPSNTWLQGTVRANMNINNQCNASWNGQLNFYRSGGGCSNTGEIAAVFLHEWGHGLDANTGGSAGENASGEAVGDTFAFLETRDSCIGPNFRPGVPCYNCTTCTGVRDLGDFALGGERTIATPANVTADDGIDCDRPAFACPYYRNGSPYWGPMRFQGHCESLIASTANWDLKNALIDEFGDAGWQKMDNIWYGSLVPSKSAYQVVSGGTCNANATVNGCGATNWYTVFLAVDDDDGNLANGTPNGCRIWDAFDAHGIACGTRPACTESAVEDFSLAIDPSEQFACAGTSVQYQVAVGSEGGFDAPVTLTLAGDQDDLGVDFLPNPVTPGSGSTLTIAVPAGFDASHLPLSVAGSASGSAGHSAAFTLDTGTEPATGPMLQLPADGATNVPDIVELAWSAVAAADSYSVQVATDPAFTDLVATVDGLPVPNWTTPALPPGRQYYWRARGNSDRCGDGPWPEQAFSFQTASAEPETFPVGGQVSGLLGSGLELVLNDESVLAITDNGEFQFALALADDSDYEVLVLAQPTTPNQLCLVGNGTGTIAGGAITDITVNCVTRSYPVGGTISGLAGNGLTLSLNGGAAFTPEGNGDFHAPGTLSDGSDYTITVVTQPASPNQVCTVANGTGTIDGGPVTDVAITCTTSRYTVGGSVNGLLGGSLTLSLAGSSDLVIDADGKFVFDTALTDGSDYEVVIAAEPTDPIQTCTIDHGSGTVAGANIEDVVVTCSDRIFHNGFQ